jgi:putative ATPase
LTDLFTTKPKPPLAELLRPKTLDEFVGQRHLLGPGKPLRLAFEAGKLHSFILWGPPGVGKTTLGRLAASATDSRFIAISAVLAGVKDIRQAIDEAQAELDNHGRSTVLFVNEIHRFNKAQQDALLPHVESGLLTLVGGTTEHPGLAVNSALLSRAQVYTLEPLSSDELNQLYERALPHLQGVTLDADALDLLKGFADGDGRAWRGRAGTSQRTGASSEGWEKGLLGCARSMTRRRQARTLDRHPPRNRPIATSRTTG